jgi:hypothetical protein
MSKHQHTFYYTGSSTAFFRPDGPIIEATLHSPRPEHRGRRLVLELTEREATFLRDSLDNWLDRFEARRTAALPDSPSQA